MYTLLYSMTFLLLRDLLLFDPPNFSLHEHEEVVVLAGGQQRLNKEALHSELVLVVKESSALCIELLGRVS